MRFNKKSLVRVSEKLFKRESSKGLFICKSDKMIVKHMAMKRRAKAILTIGKKTGGFKPLTNQMYFIK